MQGTYQQRLSSILSRFARTFETGYLHPGWRPAWTLRATSAARRDYFPFPTPTAALPWGLNLLTWCWEVALDLTKPNHRQRLAASVAAWTYQMHALPASALEGGGGGAGETNLDRSRDTRRRAHTASNSASAKPSAPHHSLGWSAWRRCTSFVIALSIRNCAKLCCLASLPTKPFSTKTRHQNSFNICWDILAQYFAARCLLESDNCFVEQRTPTP